MIKEGMGHKNSYATTHDAFPYVPKATHIVHTATLIEPLFL
jgi:hypothetical protein